MTKPEEQANSDATTKAVRRILKMLLGRKGFGDWWYNIDGKSQGDIVMELEYILRERNPDSE